MVLIFSIKYKVAWVTMTKIQNKNKTIKSKYSNFLLLLKVFVVVIDWFYCFYLEIFDINVLIFFIILFEAYAIDYENYFVSYCENNKIKMYPKLKSWRNEKYRLKQANFDYFMIILQKLI